MEHLGYYLMEQTEPAAYWREYGVGRAGAAPLIGSDAFWRQYGEPLSELGEIASHFARAAHALGNVGRVHVLELLSSDAALGLSNGNASWNSASLIGAQASVAIQRLGGGYRFEKCDCGRVFAARHYETRPTKRYCSKTCKDRVKQRRVRARRAE